MFIERYRVKIFDRTRIGVSLTATGREIVEEVQDLLRNARILDHDLRLRGSGQVRQVRLGLSTVISTFILP